VVLLFGFGPGKAEDLGEVAPIVCPNCHNEVFLHYVRSKKSVRLYFVPVVPYGTDEYLLCPVCTRGVAVSAEQHAAVGTMIGTTRAFREGRVAEPTYQAEVGRFWAGIGLVPQGAPPPQPAASVPPPNPPVVAAAEGSSLADRLAHLDELHRAGELTDEEFAAVKARVIAAG
jgi:hypothetical protein